VLRHTADALVRIHARLFRAADAAPDAPALPSAHAAMTAERAAVLHGCTLMLASCARTLKVRAAPPACGACAAACSILPRGCLHHITARVRAQPCDAPLRAQEKQVDQLVELGLQFGAAWVKGSTEDEAAQSVTHIIAVTPDSSEALWGAAKKLAVVKPAWLLCCSIMWHKVSEDEFCCEHAWVVGR
jgi:hypothetical protein